MADDDKTKNSEEQKSDDKEQSKNDEGKQALKQFLKDLAIAPIKPPDDSKS